MARITKTSFFFESQDFQNTLVSSINMMSCFFLGGHHIRRFSLVKFFRSFQKRNVWYFRPGNSRCGGGQQWVRLCSLDTHQLRTGDGRLERWLSGFRCAFRCDEVGGVFVKCPRGWRFIGEFEEPFLQSISTVGKCCSCKMPPQNLKKKHS